VEFNGCNDKKYENAKEFPYRFRPHEAEAFLRERDLASLIRKEVEGKLRGEHKNRKDVLGL